MTGYIDDLSPTQQEALSQMEAKLESITKEQRTEFDEAWANKFTIKATLLRFLRAREFDVDISFKMLTDCLEWRTKFQGIGIRNIDPETIKKELTSGKAFFHGTDKDGRPLVYIVVRNHDSHDSDDEIQRHLVYLLEKGAELMKPPTETCTIIFDLSSIHMRNLDLKTTKYFVDMLEKYYPETLGWALVVNSPLIFHGFWKLVHPILPAKTADKVKIVKEDELKKYVDESQLLSVYGGKDEYEYQYSALEPMTTIHS
jgi:hypothetical protein